MRAPRRFACSSSSRMRMPAPSPGTKPSRSLSNGREAFSGWSLRSLNARAEVKPEIPKSVIAGRAGRHRSVVHAGGAVPDGNLPARQVDDDRGDEEGADAAVPLL